jgi:transposase
VLAAADGQSDNSIAQRLAVNRKTVMLWRARFEQQGLPSLWEIAPGTRTNHLAFAVSRIAEQKIEVAHQEQVRFFLLHLDC